MSNSVNYFEIGTPDPEASTAFYSGLFDWPVGPPSEARYSMVDGQRGGLWDTSATDGATWAIFYVQVEDVAAGIEKAVGLGATVAVPLVDNGAIEFAHLVDPQGNRFGIWRPKAA
ncbi:VOC family protein [Arthrobacter wenxiniae]|uniref:VOC family protein n=1 Tax=Arthrobacter wenxiniae TaxID=2713570 RepID=A0A7Y7LXA6_9MICC|nr:VOC family protein [Arthrobacter wenxiniae]NVM94150.1 VOC family protein [Arthrobacter wenxiniae]